MAGGAIPSKQKGKMAFRQLEKRVGPSIIPRVRRNRVLLCVLVLLVVCIVFPPHDMTHSIRALLLGLLLPRDAVSAPRTTLARDVLKYINPMIGTANGGHVFPGASVPYGMAKPVADTLSPAENAAGYVEDLNPVRGFSHMHDSGTGGQPSLGNFPLFVHPGCPDDDVKSCETTAQQRATARWPYSAKAKPGYFYIRLKNSVAAEMTATDHTSLYRFTFPDADNSENGNGVKVQYSPFLTMDLSDLSNSRLGGSLQVFPETGRIVGSGKYQPSFGEGRYEAFFCADFVGAKIRRTGTKTIKDGIRDDIHKLEEAPQGEALGWIHFERPANDNILARVGVSFMSIDKACKSAEKEIPSFDFQATQRAAEDAWAEKLSVIEVDETDVDPSLLVTFWSGLYRTLLSPQNYTGENPLWQSTEPYFDSFYCIWDSFRAQHPLLTITDPVAQEEMVRSMLDIYRHEGKLPDCRMSLCKGFTQGGSNADVVVADAALKGLLSEKHRDTAYEAVVSDAEVEPQRWNVEGRGNLVSYHKLGYIPWDDRDDNGTGTMARTISRTVEYAYDDFAIAQMAKLLGKEEDYHKYLRRSANWQTLWNPDQEDVWVRDRDEFVWSDFKGFLQPRLLNGSFRYHNTRLCSAAFELHQCYLDTHWDTYEGSPWLYSFFAPQDMATLVKRMGGPKLYIERLEYFHESKIIWMANEQSFLPTYQFHYGGRPGLSSKWLHRYIPSLFNTTTAGIPGNDDCAMGAFTGFAMMGFFPVAGQDVYLLSPPFFREVKVRARSGKWAIIRVKNFDRTYSAKYIQSATLNGQRWTKSWITHRFFMEGGVLELEVGTVEGAWGTRDEDLPPSWTVELPRVS